MTLAQWCKVAGVLPTHPTTERGAVSVCVTLDHQSELCHDLWHLADYLVSSISGPVVWMLPRPSPAYLRRRNAVEVQS